MATEKSKLGTLDWKDIGKSVITAIIGSIVSGLYVVINGGGDLNWSTIKGILLIGISAGISYLVKNIFTNSEDKILAKEVKK